MNAKSIIISLRILFRYRLFTGISLIGLGVAVASFWFIGNYVENSYQFDAFHPNSERVYRISMEITAGGNVEHFATTGKPLGELLVHNYPGFSNYAKLNSHGAQTVKVNHELFKEEGIYCVNPEALDIFRFQYVNGGSENFLKGSNAIMISAQLALKYFNSLDVLDKSIILGQKEYLVKAVFQNWPQNSHLDVKAVLLADQAPTIYEPQDWFDLENYTYVMLDASNDDIALSSALDQLKVDQLNPILEDSGIDVKFIAEPLSGLYFTPGLIDDVPKGNRGYVNALAFAGLLVLISSTYLKANF